MIFAWKKTGEYAISADGREYGRLGGRLLAVSRNAVLVVVGNGFTPIAKNTALRDADSVEEVQLNNSYFLWNSKG